MATTATATATINKNTNNHVDDGNNVVMLLKSVLESSSESDSDVAGFIVDGGNYYYGGGGDGKILFMNQAACDLFECNNHYNNNNNNATSSSASASSESATSETNKTISQFVSFWSPTLSGTGTGTSLSSGCHDESYNNNSFDHTSAASTSSDDNNNNTNNNDQLSWSQVVEIASSSQQQQQPIIRKWKVTGTKMGGNTAEAASYQRRTFPGILELTPFPTVSSSTIAAEDGEGTDDGNETTIIGTVWLVYIRHADHDDIIVKKNATTTSGSVTSHHSQSQSAGENSSSLTGGQRKLRWERGIQRQGTSGTDGAGEVDSSKDGSSSKKKREKNDTTTATKAKKLDFIVSNRMDASSSSGGLVLQAQEYNNNTALSTSGENAVLEENITEAAFEAALDPIFLIDEHGMIQMVNSAALTTFGYIRSDFIGSNISMICGGGHAANHSSYMARYLATGDTRVIGKNRQLPARKKDGTEFPIELGVVEVNTFAGDVRLFCGFVKDLSELKSRERLAKEIIEIARDPTFQIDEDGVILMVNRAAETIFGYTREELVGQNISMICGSCHDRNHDYYIEQYLRTGKANIIGKSYRELPAKRKDGTEFPIQLSVVEINQPTGGKTSKRTFCGYVHDLSTQQRSSDIMRGTIDTSLDPILHCNENGIIKMVNRAAVEHLGYTREEIIGENVSLIVGKDHAANHGKYIERYLLTGEKRAMGKKRKLTARRKDGRYEVFFFVCV